MPIIHFSIVFNVVDSVLVYRYICCASGSVFLVENLIFDDTQEGAGQLYSVQTADRTISANENATMA